MKTVAAHTMQTLEVKQSKFIAHLMPHAMYETVLETLRAEHPKARHFVTAFRYLNAYDQIVEGCSDDGEPKGTSGKPTLAVLQGKELVNVAVVTVRYFGGIKLGTGGLVRAYGDAANLVIDASEPVTYEKMHAARFACEYGAMGMVEYELGQCGVAVRAKDFGTAEVVFDVEGTAEALASFFDRIDRLVRRIDS